MQILWRIDVALLHLKQETNLFDRSYLLTSNCDLSHVIFNAFRDHDRDDHGALLALFALFAHVFYFHVDIAVVLVPFANAVQVLLQLRLIQPSGLIEHRKNRLAVRLHLLA